MHAVINLVFIACWVLVNDQSCCEHMLPVLILATITRVTSPARVQWVVQWHPFVQKTVAKYVEQLMWAIWPNSSGTLI